MIKNAAYQRIRERSKCTKVGEWATVKESLHRVVWTGIFPKAEANGRECGTEQSKDHELLKQPLANHKQCK